MINLLTVHPIAVSVGLILAGLTVAIIADAIRSHP